MEIYTLYIIVWLFLYLPWYYYYDWCLHIYQYFYWPLYPQPIMGSLWFLWYWKYHISGCPSLYWRLEHFFFRILFKNTPYLIPKVSVSRHLLPFHILHIWLNTLPFLTSMTVLLTLLFNLNTPCSPPAEVKIQQWFSASTYFLFVLLILVPNSLILDCDWTLCYSQFLISIHLIFFAKLIYVKLTNVEW